MNKVALAILIFLGLCGCVEEPAKETISSYKGPHVGDNISALGLEDFTARPGVRVNCGSVDVIVRPLAFGHAIPVFTFTVVRHSQPFAVLYVGGASLEEGKPIAGIFYLTPAEDGVIREVRHNHTPEVCKDVMLVPSVVTAPKWATKASPEGFEGVF